jgi:hypothetical protein
MLNNGNRLSAQGTRVTAVPRIIHVVTEVHERASQEDNGDQKSDTSGSDLHLLSA